MLNILRFRLIDVVPGLFRFGAAGLGVAAVVGGADSEDTMDGVCICWRR